MWELYLLCRLRFRNFEKSTHTFKLHDSKKLQCTPPNKNDANTLHENKKNKKKKLVTYGHCGLTTLKLAREGSGNTSKA
jgi:hypothetical protein